MTDEKKCPLCPGVVLVDNSDPEYPLQCPACKREWVMCGEGDERGLCSKRRRVRLLKVPEVGDKHSDVITAVEMRKPKP